MDIRTIARRLFSPDFSAPGYLAARWLFLRALGLIFFSVFYSLVFQIRGLIGPNGILPARDYLAHVARVLGNARFWYAPTLYWWSTSDRFLLGVVIAGMVASLLLVLNIAPRAMLAVCLVAFLSFIAAAQDFASYQSDGMLLEAGFISLFFVPSGWRPRWGASDPPSRGSRYLLIWLMFRIYFESGIAKILGRDPEWRDFTAMDQYYQNGPLPTWIAWYAHQLPHWFHAATAVLTLVMELVLIFAIFLPRRLRIILFFLITAWQAGIILTSNYAFLNYLVLILGILLLDDKFLSRALPQTLRVSAVSSTGAHEIPPVVAQNWRANLRMGVQAIFLTWIFYVTSALLIFMPFPNAPLPTGPIHALAPFRIANDFGLFAVMTRQRLEIEFQGSRDGQTWTPYPFRNKPQDIYTPPGLYAPYQPRFDWNLWFASLGNWRGYPFVLNVEERLLEGEPDVLALFAANPFPGNPPERVRAVLWQYWFTGWSEKHDQGLWWRRDQIGLYCPSLERNPDGKITVLEMPEVSQDSR
ncbi:MAG TPA: lipase maturation factor family protein [Candidatus Acidoferrales bacterium]